MNTKLCLSALECGQKSGKVPLKKAAAGKSKVGRVASAKVKIVFQLNVEACVVHDLETTSTLHISIRVRCTN